MLLHWQSGMWLEISQSPEEKFGAALALLRGMTDITMRLVDAFQVPQFEIFDVVSRPFDPSQLAAVADRFTSKALACDLCVGNAFTLEGVRRLRSPHLRVVRLA